MTTGKEAIWNMEPNTFDEMNIPASGDESVRVGRKIARVTNQTQPPITWGRLIDQNDPVCMISTILTASGSQLSAHFQVGLDLECGSCVESSIPGIGSAKQRGQQ